MHKQYGCLVAVAGALASPIDDIRTEAVSKIPVAVTTEQMIPPYDRAVEMANGPYDEEAEERKKHYEFMTNYSRYFMNNQYGLHDMSRNVFDDDSRFNKKGK